MPKIEYRIYRFALEKRGLFLWSGFPAIYRIIGVKSGEYKRIVSLSSNKNQDGEPGAAHHYAL
jgi:hypothetical protein